MIHLSMVLKSIPFLMLILLSSCLKQQKEDQIKLKEILDELKTERTYHQSKLFNTMAANKNNLSIVSAPGFDSTYSSFVNEINKVDSMIPVLDKRLKSYWENKDDLKGFEQQVMSICGSERVLKIVDYSGGSERYHENLTSFIDALKDKKRSDGLYLQIKLTILTDQLYQLMEKNFVYMKLPKYQLELKRLCEEGKL